VVRSVDSAPRDRPRREALLRAAIEVVAERGLAGVTHRAVTERAGVPLTSASYYFGSIDELVFEALRGFAERRTQYLHEVLAEARTRDATPREISRMLLAQLTDLPRAERLAFFEILCNAPRYPEVAAPARAAVDRYLQTVRDTLAAMGFDQDATEVRGILALGMGYGILRLAHPDFDETDWLLDAIWDLHNGRAQSRDPDPPK
jgi:TetR/AcrR family transcriptional regulator, regulator of biofilm formation and stress response